MEKAKRAILESGMTYQEIASKMGIGYLTMWRLLNGKRKRVPADLISKMATLFLMSPNDLLDE